MQGQGQALRFRQIRRADSLYDNVFANKQVFGVCHIFASFNDTFVHVTDLSGKETIARITGTPFLLRHYLRDRILSAYLLTGGMKVKADRDESSPYAAVRPSSVFLRLFFFLTCQNSPGHRCWQPRIVPHDARRVSIPSHYFSRTTQTNVFAEFFPVGIT